MAKKTKVIGSEPRTWSGGSPAPSSKKQVRPISQADVVDWIKQNPKLALGNDHPKSRANGAPGGTATQPGRSNSKLV